MRTLEATGQTLAIQMQAYSDQTDETNLTSHVAGESTLGGSDLFARRGATVVWTLLLLRRNGAFFISVECVRMGAAGYALSLAVSHQFGNLYRSGVRVLGMGRSASRTYIS
jgi:hypothetical protein